jgi:hypothetical protein
LYPHTPGDNIDSNQLPNIQVGVSPDILILPSQLKHFVKVRGGYSGLVENVDTEMKMKKKIERE